MESMISYCGLLCHECGAYVATQSNDEAKRVETAEVWSKEYKKEIKPEDVYCDGCLSQGGKLFNYCDVCEIRKCAFESNVTNCASCDLFACAKLDNFFKIVPQAKRTLQNIRKCLRYGSSS